MTGLTPGKLAWAVLMYADGWSTERIADNLGRSQCFVRWNLKKAGVTLRAAHPPIYAPGGPEAEVLRQLLAAPGATAKAIAGRCPYVLCTVRKSLVAAERAGYAVRGPRKPEQSWHLTEAGIAAVAEVAT